MAPSLKDRILELSRSVDAIQVASDLHTSIRSTIATQLEGIATEADRDLVPAVRAAGDKELGDDLARLYRSLAVVNSWLDGRQQRSRDWIDRAAEFAAGDVLRDMVLGEQNRLRDGEAFAGIRDLCQKGLVDKARRQLQARRKATSDGVMRKRIDDFLADPRNFLAPMRSAPALMTYNGVGTMLHGERNRNRDGTYVTTLCLVFVFIPILPIRSYLVSRLANGWRFYGRVPLSPFAFWWRRIAILGPALIGLGAFGWESVLSSPMIQEHRMLTTASEQLAKKSYAGAITTLAPMARSGNASRAARMDDLWHSALISALGAITNAPDASAFIGSAGAAAERLHRPLNPAAAEAAEAALGRLADFPDASPVLPRFVQWMTRISADFAAKKPELAARACQSTRHPAVLAMAADAFATASRPCPAEILAKLKESLLRTRHDAWNADAVAYLRAADPPDARPVFLARVEAAWKGTAPGSDLLPIPTLPDRLTRLIRLDSEGNFELKVSGLEAIAARGDLGDPEASWHELGIARRLARAYAFLNGTDPLRWPIAKARPWAILVAERTPEDSDARIAALHYLLQDGDFARVIAMGSAFSSDERTGILVGIAYSRSGKPEEAAKLLRPIVDRDLSTFATCFKEWKTAYEQKIDNGWNALKLGTAEHSVLSHLNSLSKALAQVEAERWVRQNAERDPWVASLAAKWKKFGDIHSAASDLAMIELEIGQSLPRGEERQRHLESAERLFLELRKIYSDDPQQELQLGQVYFWLGKEKEGFEIYDKLEESADAALLHRMGEIYRNLSRMDYARRVLERAHEKATGSLKTDIALTRALSNRTLEERLEWCKKADQNNARVRFEIDQTEAEIDVEAGRYPEAIPALRRVAGYYAGQPETVTSLNNASIVQTELARATGDFKHLIEGLRLMKKAYELSTEDGIVLSNYAHSLGEAGLAALTKDALRPELLHEVPTSAWMDFVQPPPTPDEWAARAKAQPELRRSAELAQRSVVLSPNAKSGYELQSQYFTLTKDLDALRRLRGQLEDRPPSREKDQGDEQRAAGSREEGHRSAVVRSMEKWEILLPALRKAGHAPSLSFALLGRAATQSTGSYLGVEGQTLEGALKDAEEAARLFDSHKTRGFASALRASIAARRYAEKDPDFATWTKDNKDVPQVLLLALYVRKHPERRGALRELEDARVAAHSASELVAARPDRPWLLGWCWLDLMEDPARERARAGLAATPLTLEGFRFGWALRPSSAEETAEAWLAASACGDQDLAEKIAVRARGEKLLVDFFKP